MWKYYVFEVRKSRNAGIKSTCMEECFYLSSDLFFSVVLKACLTDMYRVIMTKGECFINQYIPIRHCLRNVCHSIMQLQVLNSAFHFEVLHLHAQGAIVHFYTTYMYVTWWHYKYITIAHNDYSIVMLYDIIGHETTQIH